MTAPASGAPSQGSGLTLALCVGMAVVLAATFDIGPVARLAPLWVVLPTLALLVLQFLSELRTRRFGCPCFGVANSAPSAARSDRRPSVGRARVREAVALGAVLVLCLAVQLVGVVVAAPSFLLAYLGLAARQPWWRAGVVALAVFVVLHLVFPAFLGIPLAPGRLLRLDPPVFP